MDYISEAKEKEKRGRRKGGRKKEDGVMRYLFILGLLIRAVEVLQHLHGARGVSERSMR